MNRNFELEEKIETVIRAYWYNQIVQVKNDGMVSGINGDLFYLQDCGYLMCAPIYGTWVDVWHSRFFKDPAIEGIVYAHCFASERSREDLLAMIVEIDQAVGV